MSSRNPKPSKTIPMQDLAPQNVDAVKAGNGLSPSAGAAQSLTPEEAARQNRPAPRTGLTGLRPK
jgi:hypothetical protein